MVLSQSENRVVMIRHYHKSAQPDSLVIVAPDEGIYDRVSDIRFR
jgi:hypothetical protein